MMRSKVTFLLVLALAYATLNSIAATPACGAFGDQLYKITAPDRRDDEFFGRSVSISGDNIVVGSQAGSAHIFDANTGIQRFTLTSLDRMEKDQFGETVAISGDRAIVGAPGDDQRGLNDGAAYLFDVTTGQQLFKLAPAGATGRFGRSVAIHGDTAVVGSNLGDSAYVFDASTGQLIHRLTAPNASSRVRLGFSVATNDSHVLVNASSENDNGAVYIYDRDTGQQLRKLVPPGTVLSFGSSLAISGHTAIVSAIEEIRGIYSGSAYVFDITTGEQLAKLNTSNDWALSRFAVSVAIDGNIAVVGSPAESTDGGFAYLFDVSTGQELLRLSASDATAWDLFGQSVAIENNRAVVGAMFADSAYIFSTVPEPSTISLIISAIGVLAIRRRRYSSFRQQAQAR